MTFLADDCLLLFFAWISFAREIQVNLYFPLVRFSEHRDTHSFNLMIRTTHNRVRDE